jgi:hypothetical protein
MHSYRVFYGRTTKMTVIEEDSRSDLAHNVSNVGQEQYLDKMTIIVAQS